MEEWRDIVGYQGYQVSNLGRVKSLYRIINWNYPAGQRLRTIPEKIKSQTTTPDGYKRTNITNNDGVQVSKKIHRFVAIAFIPNPENKKYVNHKNGVKHDNRVENLEWVTSSENIKHAYATGLKNISKEQRERIGRIGKQRQKSIHQYNSNGLLIASFKSVSNAVTILGISQSCISRVLLGQRSHTHGFKFRYA